MAKEDKTKDKLTRDSKEAGDALKKVSRTRPWRRGIMSQTNNDTPLKKVADAGSGSREPMDKERLGSLSAGEPRSRDLERRERRALPSDPRDRSNGSDERSRAIQRPPLHYKKTRSLPR